MNNTFTPKIISFTLLNLLFFTSTLYAQTACPGCLISVPSNLAEDTFYIADIPDATKGNYYEEDMGFRMPKTTSPIAAQDPSVPSGLSLDEIKVNNVSGLPPGLDWTTDKFSYDPGDETDGCLRLCGTPLVSGFFQVAINATARIAFIERSATFRLDMYVAPSVSTTDGFTLINNEDCGTAVVSFENRIPSGGEDGFSYVWDLGNGLTTTDENPIEQVYDAPGVYYVNYRAIIDTTGYILTKIDLIDLDCSDLLSGPDVVVTIKDPDDEVIYESREYENTNVPFSINLNLPIGDGNYQIKAKDLDSGLEFGDKTCAESSFTKFSDVLDGSGYELRLTIIHPVDTVIAVDSIVVYAEPEPPIITLATNEFFFCEGDSMILTSSYNQGNQWYVDGEEIAGATSDVLVVKEAGMYSVVYTDPNGCQSTSDESMIDVFMRPAEPTFSNLENVLSVVTPANLPDDYQLQWYFNGDELVGETGLSICIMESGDYTLLVIDNDTGCSNEYTTSELFDPEFNCLSTSLDQLVWSNQITIFPNPNNGVFQVSLGDNLPVDLSLSLIDITGKVIEHRQVDAGIPQTQDYAYPNLSSGVYVLLITSADEKISRKVVVK